MVPTPPNFTPSSIGFTPLFERVLILPDKIETVSSSGIITSVNTNDRPNTGKIIAIGHLCNTPNLPISLNDHVIYQKYAGLNIELNGILYHLVMVNDILGIFDDAILNSFKFMNTDDY